MNPWFATAAGVMIAATLWVYHPHAQLSLPFGRPTITDCKQAGCSAPHGKHDKRSQASTGNQKLHKPSARHRAARAHRDAGAPAKSRPVISYRLAPSWSGSVLLVITLPSQAGRHWNLALTLPGDRIFTVGQADWQRVGTDSVTVSPGSGIPSGYDQPSGYRQDGRSLSPTGTEFTVWASGPTTVPSGCVFNGSKCIFHLNQASHAAG